MAREEGLRGMFKGNWTNCVRIVPNSAVKFLTYEQLSRQACSLIVHLACDRCGPQKSSQNGSYKWLLYCKQIVLCVVLKSMLTITSRNHVLMKGKLSLRKSLPGQKTGRAPAEE